MTAKMAILFKKRVDITGFLRNFVSDNCHHPMTMTQSEDAKIGRIHATTKPDYRSAFTCDINGFCH
jgi:hypothetical protein